MKNLDIALKLKEDISVSWATHSDASLLSSEINNWLEEIRKNGKLNYLYKRYFGKHPAVPHNTTKYTLIKKGDISPFDKLFRKESKKLGWDWRLLASPTVMSMSEPNIYITWTVTFQASRSILPNGSNSFWPPIMQVPDTYWTPSA